MSDTPPPANPSPHQGWTLDALRIYFEQLINERDRRYEQRFQAQESAVNAAITAADRAVTKAEVAVEKRFEGVNEFRAALSDSASRLLSRAEAEAEFKSMREKLDDLGARLNRAEGHRGGAKDDRAGLYAALGAVATLISIAAVLVAALR